MATSRGHLMVAEIQTQRQALYSSSWKITYQCNNFTRNPISILRWDQYYDYRLYITDSSGQIFILHNVKDLKNLMVLPQPQIIIKVSTEILQLEVCMDLILLSTQSKYVIYDLSVGELTQIGTKSVRSDGQSYGVCFFAKDTSADNHVYNCIFCSRPKSRLWECDLKGTVRFTHQFKDSLINQTPKQIINGEDICHPPDDSSSETPPENGAKAPPTPTFGKLCAMTIAGLDYRLIVTYANSPRSCLVVINPINACIVSYCVLNVTHIRDIYCIDCDIYLIYNSSEEKRLRLSRISLVRPDQCLELLIDSRKFVEAANLVIKHLQYFTEWCTQNSTKLNIRATKLLEQLWSGLSAEERYQFGSVEQLIIGGMSREKSFLIDSSQELSLNSIDSNASDVYNRLYFDINEQYNDSALDVVNTLDVGFTELKKLKDIVLSKLNSNQTNTDEQSAIAGDMNERQLENNNYLNDSHNGINLIDNNKNSDDYKRHELESALKLMENRLNESQTLDQFRCDCGSPLPGSHLAIGRQQESIQSFLISNTDFMEYSVIDLLDICKNNGLWSLYMKLLLKCQEYYQYLRAGLMLNDVNFFLQSDFIGNYLSNNDNLETLLQLFSRQRDAGSDLIVRCIECDKSLKVCENSISWETIIRFCINTIGVEEAIALLAKFLDQKPCFSVDFYLLLLRMRMICVFQSPITSEKLNKLITHLNSVSKVKSPLTVSPSTSSSPSGLTSMATTATQSPKGFKLKLSGQKCAKCETSLVPNGSKSRQKLVAFYCRHIYHKMCLNIEQNYCIICTKRERN